MWPLKHIIASAILSILLFPLIGYNTIIVFLSGVLIDVDHYLFYVKRKKNISLKKAYYYCRDTLFHDVLHIFHVIEFWLLILILSFFYKIFLFISIGIIFHLYLDVIHLYYHPEKINARTFSIITWILRRR